MVRQSEVICSTAKCRLFVELELVKLAGVLIKHTLTKQLNESRLHMNEAIIQHRSDTQHKIYNIQ